MTAGNASEQMTAEQHATLAAELAELEGPKRSEAVQTIANARSEGDLSENFGYHDAKNAQGLLERQITILRDQLERTTIVEAGGSEVVMTGSYVTFSDEEGEQMELELSNLGGPGVVSRASPLGAALFGKRAGDKVRVKGPRKTWTATIVSIRAA
jgi:transcription elongation factor GreA